MNTFILHQENNAYIWFLLQVVCLFFFFFWFFFFQQLLGMENNYRVTVEVFQKKNRHILGQLTKKFYLFSLFFSAPHWERSMPTSALREVLTLVWLKIWLHCQDASSSIPHWLILHNHGTRQASKIQKSLCSVHPKESLSPNRTSSVSNFVNFC